MTIRALNLPKDLVPLEQMLIRTFQYPENPEWSIQADEEEDISREIKILRRMWPLIRVMQVISPQMRDLFRGFVWEEEGQIGGVVIAQRRGTTSTWMIGTVGVLPEFRRRGLARKLLTRMLDDLRARGATRIGLGVIEKNVPAYSLYKSLGFDHFGSLIEYHHKPEHAPDVISLPGEYREGTMARFDWKSRYELEKRITPESITRYDPVEIGRFRTPLPARLLGLLMDCLRRLKQGRYLYRSGEIIVGQLVHRTSKSGKGTSSISARLDPACTELASYMLVKAVRAVLAINPKLRIQFTVSSWMPALSEAAEELGFTVRVRHHLLGLIL